MHSIHDSPAALGRAAAEHALALADAAIAARGRFVVALSGSTMSAMLAPRLLEEAQRGRSFAHWHIFLADERCVAHSHPDANVALVRRHIVEPLAAAVTSAADALPAAHVYALDIDALAVSVDAAARAYEASMRAVLGVDADADADAPAFDLVALGMGPDGHTASLFPAHALLAERARLIAPITDSPKPPPARITFTLPLIARARHVVFMCAGAEKTSALRRAWQQAPRAADQLDDAEALRVAAAIAASDAAALPAQLVQAVARRLVWFVDRAAAGADAATTQCAAPAPSSL